MIAMWGWYCHRCPTEHWSCRSNCLFFVRAHRLMMAALARGDL